MNPIAAALMPQQSAQQPGGFVSDPARPWMLPQFGAQTPDPSQGPFNINMPNFDLSSFGQGMAGWRGGPPRGAASGVSRGAGFGGTPGFGMGGMGAMGGALSRSIQPAQQPQPVRRFGA